MKMLGMYFVCVCRTREKAYNRVLTHWLSVVVHDQGISKELALVGWWENGHNHMIGYVTNVSKGRQSIRDKSATGNSNIFIQSLWHG